MLRLGFWVLAALACVLVGGELQRPVPDSLLALWERSSPGSLIQARSLAVQLGGEIWPGIERALALRPSVLCAGAALAAWALAWASGVSRPRMSSVRALGLGMAALGLVLLGSDLTYGGFRTLAAQWRALDPASFLPIAQSGMDRALRWPGASLALVGPLLAWMAQASAGVRAVPPPHAVPLAARLRGRDVRRTVAYLESQRDWPRRIQEEDDR
jgi:hypothetical protein